MISVDQLAAISSLGLRYLAGSRGGSRLVTWAHACDLDDPWTWFESGDLVMTTGGGLPADEPSQREWMAKLIESKVSGLVVAPGPSAPNVSAGMLDVAEEQGFPVLSASYELQFVSLARTVIESAIETERQRVETIKRLYDVYWHSLHARSGFSERLSALETSTGWALHVADHSTGEITAAGRRAGARQGRTAEPAKEIALPSVGDVALVAADDTRPLTDLALLEHIGGLVALELEHDAAYRDRLRASGQDLFTGLLDETITLSAVWPELRHRGLAPTIVVACWRAESGSDICHDDIHRHLWLHDCAPLLLPQGSTLLGIVPDDSDLLHRMTQTLSPHCVVGISTPLTLNSQIRESARQARLAVTRAHERGVVMVRHGDDEVGEVFARSVDEVRAIVRRILGPLIDYDRANDSNLVETVRVFLSNDSSWQKTADSLSVHRQTLVYRLKKVENLTGLKPTSTEGCALLWLALTSAQRAELSVGELGT